MLHSIYLYPFFSCFVLHSSVTLSFHFTSAKHYNFIHMLLAISFFSLCLFQSIPLVTCYVLFILFIDYPSRLFCLILLFLQSENNLQFHLQLHFSYYTVFFFTLHIRLTSSHFSLITSSFVSLFFLFSWQRRQPTKETELHFITSTFLLSPFFIFTSFINFYASPCSFFIIVAGAFYITPSLPPLAPITFTSDTHPYLFSQPRDSLPALLLQSH